MSQLDNDLPDTIFDAVDAGLIVLDRDGRIVRWNRWLTAASGMSAQDVRTKSLPEVFPSSDMRPLVSAMKTALNLGTSSLLTHTLHRSLFPLRTRIGRELLHDVLVSGLGSPPERCLIQINDITRSAQREQTLRERQNARYDAVVESASDVIITMDVGGIIQLANPAAARQFGYTAQELIGQNADMLFEARDVWRQIWDQAIAGKASRQPTELLARRKDGSLSHLEISASRWQSNARPFVTAILRDVNERRANEAALRASETQARTAAQALADLNATLESRVEERTEQLMQAEEALRQSQKMEAVGQLTGGIAHDFNNLLQGIIGALDRIQKYILEGRIADVDRFIKGALKSANRAAALTHRLLAFSRRQPVDPRPVNVNQLIGSVEELLRRSIGEATTMKIVPGPGLWLVRCDNNQLENALLNLAINARDAMPKGGVLTVETANTTLTATQATILGVPPGDYVRITVRDTGVGMPADVKERAFDPFFTTKPIGQGTGLGLSMIYGFVRQSGGAIAINSRVGEGTAIDIHLPRFQGELEAASSGKRPAGEDHTGSNEVVLVVEDEAVVRLLIVEVLNDLGYRALEAADGTAGLRILQSDQRIDLLVTDIGLPGMNGRQLADAARVKRPGLKTLFMTGYAENAASSNFLEADMAIVTKPFTMETLAARIRKMIESGSGK